MALGPLSDLHVIPSTLSGLLILVTTLASLWLAYTGKPVAGRRFTAVIVLMAGNVLAFLFQGLGFFRPVFFDTALVPGLFLTGRQWWSPLTSMFMHGGFLHILGNMIFLWLFGNKIEDRAGRKTMVTMYLAAGLFAVAVTLVGVQFWTPALDWLIPHPATPNVGASGAIFGLVGFTITAWPREKVLIPIPLGFVAILHPVRPVWAAIIYIGINFLYILVNPGVAWWAHLAGMAVGAAWGVAWRKKGPRVRIDGVTGWGSGGPVQYTYQYRYR